MSLEMTLHEENLSQDFKDSLAEYYQALGFGGDYAGHLLKQWADDENVLVYRAAKESQPVGWIVYNPQKSLVKQVLVRKNQVGKGMEASMLDALIAKESLVAAEILSSDQNAYRILQRFRYSSAHY